MIIYKVLNKINGKVYIGQTNRSLETRMKAHFGTDDKYPFHNALRKYGQQSFNISILDYAETKKELNEKERRWIELEKCIWPNGYNLTCGGGGISGYRHTLETKKKIGENSGPKRPEIAKKISEALKKFHPSAESNRKRSETLMGHFVSEESRKKMSDSGRNRRIKCLN